MHGSPWLVATALCAILSRVCESQAHSASPDSSLVGRHVRVRTIARERLTGVLLGLWLPDSLTLSRDSRRPSQGARLKPSISIRWPDVRQIEGQRGNKWLLGAVAGFGVSIAFGAYITATQGGASDLSRFDLMLLATATSCAIIIPIGALIGSASPHWRTVYQRRE